MFPLSNIFKICGSILICVHTIVKFRYCMTTGSRKMPFKLSNQLHQRSMFKRGPTQQLSAISTFLIYSLNNFFLNPNVCLKLIRYEISVLAFLAKLRKHNISMHITTCKSTIILDYLTYKYL